MFSAEEPFVREVHIDKVQIAVARILKRIPGADTQLRRLSDNESNLSRFLHDAVALGDWHSACPHTQRRDDQQHGGKTRTQDRGVQDKTILPVPSETGKLENSRAKTRWVKN